MVQEYQISYTPYNPKHKSPSSDYKANAKSNKPTDTLFAERKINPTALDKINAENLETKLKPKHKFVPGDLVL